MKHRMYTQSIGTLKVKFLDTQLYFAFSPSNLFSVGLNILIGWQTYCAVKSSINFISDWQ